MDRVRADRAAVLAAQKADRERRVAEGKAAKRLERQKAERSGWLAMCARTRTRWLARLQTDAASKAGGDRAAFRAARHAWLASDDKTRSDGTTNVELAVWLREFIADTGITHKFAHGKWSAWAKDKPHVRLKTANQVRWRVIFDTRLQDLFDGGAA